jgi:hypothetical protein
MKALITVLIFFMKPGVMSLNIYYNKCTTQTNFNAVSSRLKRE